MRDWRDLDMSCETMSQAEALEIIQKEADAMGLPMLETLTWMTDNYEELDSIEKAAYRRAMRGFRQLFAVKLKHALGHLPKVTPPKGVY